MRRFALLFALLSAAAPATAGALLDLELRDLDTGRRLEPLSDGTRLWVEGVPGHRYAVTLVNRTPQRLLAVLSVDGVNAINGRTARSNQSGYVLGPYERAEIRGWRKNLSDVAEFVFTDLPDSYAARTGRPQNVGVVGVAVFREAPRWEPAQPYPYPSSPPIAERDAAQAERAAGASADSARAPAPASEAKSVAGRAQQQLGTGHGQRRFDPARTTQFLRASSRPEEIVQLHYDDYLALVDRGLLPPPRERWAREADPFPAEFVPDPW